MGHFCAFRTCCNNYDVNTCLNKVLGLLIEMWFGPLGKRLPAENRWYTFRVTLQVQAGGHLCHKILPRVLQKVFGDRAQQEPDIPGDEDDVDDFTVDRTKKSKKSLAFHSDDVTMETLTIALLASGPVDKLSARIQHLDTTGDSMRELVAEPGLLGQTAKDLWRIIHGDAAISLLSHVLPVLLCRVCWALRVATMEIAAGLWSRLENRYRNWPFRLLRGKQPPRNGDMREDVGNLHNEFWTAKECCLDSWFSEPFRKKLQCPGDLDRACLQKTDAEAEGSRHNKSGLTMWGEACPKENMNI